ncbi:hypothetical protein [Haloferula sp. BvORR071]|uniref:hypothetical protein n=1 Tax=Haloferula sp. BvORR071 TaxID=1396141 RepID=UPI0005593D7E|nr:hypothetical protein [Haloferula sp. BvORR071]
MRTDEEKRAAYELALKRMEHEHSLESARLNWFLAFEAFLFTGVSFGQLNSSVAMDPRFFRWLVPGVGTLVALATLLGVAAAQQARTALKRWYQKYVKEEPENDPASSTDSWFKKFQDKYFKSKLDPTIENGSSPHPPFRPSPRAGEWGRITSWALPLIIVGGWIAVMCFCHPGTKTPGSEERDTSPGKEGAGTKKEP